VADRILFYCQHVLGMGHLVRSTEIVRELSRDSQVVFVSGGEPPEGFRFLEHENVVFLQLPPLKTSADFSDLQVCDSTRSMHQIMAHRRSILLRAFADYEPDVLVTELFPFGRKKFRFELLPLLEHVQQQSRRPLVVSSVRDILVARKDQEEYEQQVCDLVNTFYDLILVHGNKNLQTFEHTFSRVNDLRCPVAYTGYVVQHSHPKVAESGRSPRPEQAKPTIVASIGSGQYLTGQSLLETSLHAARLLQGRIPHEFHVFAGPLMPEETYDRLQALARESSNVTLSRFTPDLGAVLRRAELSVSMAGYNTIMDVLMSGVRALVYPVTSNGDQEQIMRAESLAKAGVVEVIRTEELAPEELAQKIEWALSRPPKSITFDCNGSVNSVRILKRYLAAKRDRSLGAPESGFCSREPSETPKQVSDLGRAEYVG
jgi:predicted glycosyltransferase